MRNAEFVVDKGIALPGDIRPGPAPTYPFAKMAPGDSFFLRAKSDEVSRVIADRVRGAAGKFRKRHWGRFAVRLELGGVRVWRIE